MRKSAGRCKAFGKAALRRRWRNESYPELEIRNLKLETLFAHETKVPFPPRSVLPRLRSMSLSTFRLLLSALLLSVLCNCEQFSTQYSGDVRARGSALVSIPLDATSGGEMYEGSGKEIGEAVAAAFRKHVRRVDLLAGNAFTQSMDPNTGASRYDYVVIPSIIHWEDHNLRKSQREGEIMIGVRVLRARDGVLLADWRITKPSKVSTLFHGGPADQLAEPIREYVDKLFAQR
jgi:hypothetical protein